MLLLLLLLLRLTSNHATADSIVLKISDRSGLWGGLFSWQSCTFLCPTPLAATLNPTCEWNTKPCFLSPEDPKPEKSLYPASYFF